MSDLQSLLVNSIWVLGLASLLATISYMDWYRTVQKWSWAETFHRPRGLVPLYLSLTCFCLGLLISQLWFSPPNFGELWGTTFWKPLVWVLFTLLFAFQSVHAIMDGRRHVWDSLNDRDYK